MSETEKELWNFIAANLSADQLLHALNDYHGWEFSGLLDNGFAQHLVDEGFASASDFSCTQEDDDDDGE